MQDLRLVELTDKLRGAIAGRSGVALALLGGPGIGKSWLATQALAQLACRSASCSATWPLAQIVAALPASPKLASWAQGTLDAAADAQQVETGALVAAVNALLKQLAPFVLHLDDFQDAQPDVSSFAVQLADGVKRLRGVVLVVGSRHEAPPTFDQVWLEPLGEESATALLEATAGGQLPAPACAWIFARAAGNPLFTLEYLRQLSRAGHLWSDGRRWNWREPAPALRPPRVGAVIEHMVANAKALGEGAAALIEARAVLPAGPLDAGLWAVVADVSPEVLAAASERLVRQGVLRGGDFAHGLVRDVARAALSAQRLRELALRALAALRHDPVAAAPFVDAAGLTGGDALELLMAAVAAAPNKVAAARLRAAASSHAVGAERARLAFEAGLVLVNVDFDAALALLGTAAAEPTADVEMVTSYAHALAGAGQLDEVRELAEEYRRRGASEAAVAGLLLTSYNAAGRHGEALELWNAYPELQAASNASWLRAAAASALASGGMELATELLDRGIGLPTVSRQLRCEFLSVKALTAFHRGDYNVALTTIAEAAHDLQELGSLRALSTVRLNQAAFFKQLGRYAEMNDALEECLSLRRSGSEGRSYAFAQAALAELRIDQGRFEEADDLLIEALETLELYGPSRFLINTIAMTSSLHLAKGDYVTAVSFGERALLLAREAGAPRLVREILFDAGSANARLGNAAAAQAQADEMAALGAAAGASPADDCRTQWVTGLTLEAQGARQAAAEALAGALAAARQGGQELEANKIAIDLGRVTKNPPLATEALAWFDEHGLGLGRILVARAFPRSGAAPVVVGHVTEAERRLEVLGEMRLGPPGAPQGVKGEQRRRLLALLLLARLAGEPGVSDLRLSDALYPQRQDAGAHSDLKQLVYQVRRKYGQQVVARTGEGYALGAAVKSDVEEFLAATAEPGQGAALLAWRGPFLQDAPEVEAGALAALVTDRAVELASASASEHPDSCARLARWLQEAAPYDEALVALEVRAHLHKDDGHGASAALERARRRFEEVGVELPATPAALVTGLRRGR